MKGRVLIVAGSDSGGGAGIQADIKTITCLGGYAATAITALTAQNTVGVQGIHEIPADFVKQQMLSVLDDIGADALKTGMLNTAEIVTTVAGTVREQAPKIPLVVDPVMVATSGSSLAQDDVAGALLEELIPLATVVTPNLPEAETLTGMTIKDESAMAAAAEKLLDCGVHAVLLKGGHLSGDTVVDLLALRSGQEFFRSARIETDQTHGTGCTLASAIACGLAQNLPIRNAVIRAGKYVYAALESAPGYGKGFGPINHIDAAGQIRS